MLTLSRYAATEDGAIVSSAILDKFHHWKNRSSLVLIAAAPSAKDFFTYSTTAFLFLNCARGGSSLGNFRSSAELMKKELAAAA